MAKRLIDANELKRQMIAFTTGTSANYLVIENIVMMIDRADAVDAVEVIRCKDCKHTKREHFDAFGRDYCAHWKREVKADEFCSRGEKRTNADNHG